jgi:hypothetical protein
MWDHDLTPEEEAADRLTGHLRFNIELLAKRLLGAAEWLKSLPETRQLAVGCFGASTGKCATENAIRRDERSGDRVCRRGVADVSQHCGEPDESSAMSLRRSPRSTPSPGFNRSALTRIALCLLPRNVPSLQGSKSRLRGLPCRRSIPARYDRRARRRRRHCTRHRDLQIPIAYPHC